MRLEKLRLVDFKNYANADIALEGMIHCFLGKNGSGKTNLLEAIHYLSFTKGVLPGGDVSNIRRGQSRFLISGQFRKEDKPSEIICSFSASEKKIISDNGKEYARFSEHIGKYPLVMVAPNDVELIWDGPELRRRYFDTLLAQSDPEYLRHLILYQFNLRQRNGLLRMVAERGTLDEDLLSSYDDALVKAGQYIFEQRSSFTGSFQPMVHKRYHFLIQGRGEAVGVSYASELAVVDFRKELAERLDRDKALGRTTVGIHRDDFLFTLDGFGLKEAGSQGQQKSFLIALKLAEFETLSAKAGFKPLLLLDDIFDKLDDDRIVQLMKLVSGDTFGQIFITDARPGRSLEVLKASGLPSQNFLIGEGRLTIL